MNNEEIKEKDIIQKSIECLTNAKLNDTTYEIARDIVLDYITNLQEEIHKKEAMHDSLAVDYRLSQEENERLKKEIPSPDNYVSIENQMRISSVSHEINYRYFKTLYEKATKDIVIDDLVYKCEDMQKLIEGNEKLYIEKEDYKSRNENAEALVDITIEIIKQQPTKDDSWILSRLYGVKFALNGGDKE